MSQKISKKTLTTNENILYELNNYDRQRKPQTLIEDDRLQCIPADPVLKSLSCPICLDLFNRTMVTTTCLHRFCADCIHRWLKSENKVCPTCRKVLKSKRYLRSDAELCITIMRHNSSLSWLQTNRTMIDEYCNMNLPVDYDLHWLIAYATLAFIGLFYALLGYRWWRLTMFITSFGLGSLLLYIILSTQPTMNESQLLGVSCSIATLFGLIGALLQYVGLFINGFCFGLILSITTFISLDMKNRANGVSTSFWLPIGLILLLGLICAIITLRFQKTMIIITSSCFAGVCQILVLDYFLQSSVLFHFIHKRLLFESTSTLCLRHWLIALILPIILCFGIVIQFTCTGRNYDHRDSWQRAISAGKKHYKTANLKRIRRHYNQDTLREHIIPDESNRFRYFYHIRRAHGDALSSDFIQNVRQQNSASVRLTTNQNSNNNNNNNNNDPSQAITSSTGTATAVTCTRKDADSTTTTLTHLI
ncbi:hypothetical protein I4U23_002149 [Adineta vaga]|nr:hypothetical protein I4U23_002149 [Adineta vaga]